MASIDYQEARKEIIKIFTNRDTNERKVVFWYDAPANFYEDIEADNYECCKVLVCNKNEFAIKKTIEHEDPTSDYLVYVPNDKPVDMENWLLDMLMYGEEYYADTVALTMRRLNLTNIDLRRTIERYAKFFDAEGRTKKLTSYVEISDRMTNDELKMAMMSVLVKASSRSIESVLTELVFDGTDGNKYTDLVKFGFEEYLWDEISQYYNYEGDQKIETLVNRFFFTALMEQKAELYSLPSFYEQFIIHGQGKMDAKFFVDKMKSDKRYKSLQLALSSNLKIEGLIVARNISCVQTADVFECIDLYIVKKISESLVNGSLDYESFDKVISNRLNSMWYETHKAEYEMLSNVINFYRSIEKGIPMHLLATEYVKLYTDSLYLVDTYYRRACSNYKLIVYPSTEMEELIGIVDDVYQSKFLNLLGHEYSAALTLLGGWDFVGIDMNDGFYQRVQKNNYKKCFVIISDGLRYEIGHELFEKIRVDSVLNGSEEIKYAVSPIPSETRFGMASLLPHSGLSYENKGVFADSMPTNSVAARDAILKAKNRSYAAIGYDEINNMSRVDLRTYMADKSLVYIYHNVVDNAGEHNESKVFDVVPGAIDEILMLIRKLFNSLQISNFYVTADHGFLYRRKEIEESQKYSDIVSLHATETSKRFLISVEGNVDIPYTIEFDMAGVSEKSAKIIAAYGYDLFKTQGGGIQYVHGGTSLQETIVPVIYIGELSAAKNKDSVSQVGVRLKSIVRKITNRSFTLEFEQYEKVEERKLAITCETYLVDEDNNQVSGVYKYVAASESDDADSRCTKIRFSMMNIEFDRNKRYFLILRNADKPDEYIEKEQFIVDILNFKMF